MKYIILSKLRDLRDRTPCDEESHRHCGCERFDEIIDLIDEHYYEI
ncbi:MAG: hypothetical protein GY760_25945 [Deltaproteobacteria bacterium]|nr:hypothetical protein [Deltaproteobacteria bacterium]